MTDSQIIAVFMGIKVTNSMGLLWIVDEQDDIPDYKNGRVYSPSIDWSHLMQVVEKIETMEFSVMVIGRYTRIMRPYPYKEFSTDICDTKIQSVYKAVVEFIKWYNSQK